MGVKTTEVRRDKKEMKKKKSALVSLIIGGKAYSLTRKMADATIGIAKQKYEKENVNAIFAVEKSGMVSMLVDVFEETDSLLKEVESWEQGGYKCYYNLRKEKGGQ